jgi:GTP cyclohydrolase I
MTDTSKNLSQIIRDKNKLYQLPLYDGLKLIEYGANRGTTDYAGSAEMLGITEPHLRKIIERIKGMYGREPKSTITVIEYVQKLKEANITSDSIGIGEGKYQAGRKNHSLPYSIDNFDFILQKDNLAERDQRMSDRPHHKSKRVYTPFGIVASLKDASVQFDVDVNTIKRWIDSDEEQYADWFYEGEYPEKIAKWLKRDNKRFWAGDNISEYVTDIDMLINDLTFRFEQVLKGLVIDTETDPNSKGTAKRLAKMYVTETMAGRYDPIPDATSFPNDSADRYEGMLVVRSEIRSMCSHHHQPVVGVVYIGIIAAEKLIGLSKYTRIAQWCARRGTLQEELAMEIAKEIMTATGSQDIGIHVGAEHGCCTNRGIMATSSLTQTTVLKGAFKDDPATKKEFFDNIKLQQSSGGKGVY